MHQRRTTCNVDSLPHAVQCRFHHRLSQVSCVGRILSDYCKSSSFSTLIDLNRIANMVKCARIRPRRQHRQRFSTVAVVHRSLMSNHHIGRFYRYSLIIYKCPICIFVVFEFIEWLCFTFKYLTTEPDRKNDRFIVSARSSASSNSRCSFLHRVKLSATCPSFLSVKFTITINNKRSFVS